MAQQQTTLSIVTTKTRSLTPQAHATYAHALTSMRNREGQF